MAINNTKKTSTTNTSSAPGRSIRYIVIHYTAGVTSKSGSAANTAGWFMNPNAQASADFIVDDANIVQFNPDISNRYCWHCGGSKYNNKGGSLYGFAKNSNSIGIEICSTNDTGKMTNSNDGHYSYTAAVLNMAVELTKYLMSAYGIDTDHVIRHYDVNGKPCPGIVGWNADSGDESKWRAFKAKLTGAGTSSSSTIPYTVRVAIKDLNIRKGPGTNYDKTGKHTGIGTFTIEAESVGQGASRWGRLKSGAGWISLDYCKKV